MRTRIMAGAYLCYQDEVLMMRRSPDRKIAPDKWATVGGHVEPDEINDPLAACLREIKEESGICPEDITDIKLRYIITRNFDDEIRIIFSFIGNVLHKSALPKSAEGELHWVAYDSLPGLPMTFSAKQTVLHWRSNQDPDQIFLGAVNHKNDEILWSPL